VEGNAALLQNSQAQDRHQEGHQSNAAFTKNLAPTSYLVEGDSDFGFPLAFLEHKKNPSFVKPLWSKPRYRKLGADKCSTKRIVISGSRNSGFWEDPSCLLTAWMSLGVGSTSRIPTKPWMSKPTCRWGLQDAAVDLFTAVSFTSDPSTGF
jgi:hypothetical protein